MSDAASFDFAAAFEVASAAFAVVVACRRPSRRTRGRACRSTNRDAAVGIEGSCKSTMIKRNVLGLLMCTTMGAEEKVRKYLLPLNRGTLAELAVVAAPNLVAGL